RDERDDRETDSDPERHRRLAVAHGPDGELKSLVESVGERLITREKQRSEQVRSRVAAKLREEAGRDGFVHLFGVRRDGRVLLERLACARTPSPSPDGGLRWEL